MVRSLGLLLLLANSGWNRRPVLFHLIAIFSGRLNVVGEYISRFQKNAGLDLKLLSVFSVDSIRDDAGAQEVSNLKVRRKQHLRLVFDVLLVLLHLSGLKNEAFDRVWMTPAVCARFWTGFTGSRSWCT